MSQNLGITSINFLSKLNAPINVRTMVARRVGLRSGIKPTKAWKYNFGGDFGDDFGDCV